MFPEFHGTEAGVAEQAERFGEIASEFSGGDFQWTVHQENRKQAVAAGTLKPGCSLWATDVCVPVSKLAECIVKTKKDLAESFLIAPWSAMSAMATFISCSCSIPMTPRISPRPSGSTTAWSCARAMSDTSTGERGVGLGKM